MTEKYDPYRYELVIPDELNYVGSLGKPKFGQGYLFERNGEFSEAIIACDKQTENRQAVIYDTHTGELCYWGRKR